MNGHLRRRRVARQRGMGIIETMVGILIGMIVVLAVYNVFSLAEGYKRTTVGAADAQTTGLFAQYMLAREIGNAGNGVALDAANLQNCTLAEPKWQTFGAAAPIRPIPALISDGGGANLSDQLIVTYSTPSRVVNSVLMFGAANVTGAGPIYVQSPNGFDRGDWIVVSDGGGNCELTRVTAFVPDKDWLGPATTGMVELTVAGLTKTYTPGGDPLNPNLGGARVLNLGTDGTTIRSDGTRGSSAATRTLFDVASSTGPGPCGGTSCQLRTTDLLNPGATAVPIAQNIVLMKAQYGVDCNNNGVIEWTSATAGGACGGLSFTPNDLTLPPWNAVNLARIRAIRIAVVVRSDEPDSRDPTLVGQTATLFDCSAHDATCQGAIAINNTVLADGWRHRTYETIVPMRNAIYNNGT